MHSRSLLIFYAAAFASANPVSRRQVAELNEEATAEAHQRDATATRAFSDVQIRTSDGRCLFVDPLSGDFRANLTPVQIADCGSTDGQGWDVITAGEHNDQAGQMLIVSTLTQACLNFDPRRADGNQVNLFSCGGRADGGGRVTNSQLYAFAGGAGPLSLKPSNCDNSCLTATGNTLDVADCTNGANDQTFSIGDGAAAPAPIQDGEAGTSVAPAAPTATSPFGNPAMTTRRTKTRRRRPGATKTTLAGAVTSTAVSEVVDNPMVTTTAAPTSAPAADAGEQVPVSRGGFLNPDAVAEAHRFDATATRALESVNIRAADGRCFSVDETAGDFRQNLIPIQMVECADVPEQKFDVVTQGVHNDGEQGQALLMSVVTDGCISFDGRRQAGDTVTVFSCGGRADGGKSCCKCSPLNCTN